MFIYTQRDLVSKTTDQQAAAVYSPIFGKEDQFCLKFKFYDNINGDGNTSLKVEVDALPDSSWSTVIWSSSMTNSSGWQQTGIPVTQVNHTFQIAIRLVWDDDQMGSISLDDILIEPISSSCSSEYNILLVLGVLTTG